ncbi:MAG TPA: hypothetical protein VF400_04625, partial [Anaeromyxobacteraceae bacterium]
MRSKISRARDDGRVAPWRAVAIGAAALAGFAAFPTEAQLTAAGAIQPFSPFDVTGFLEQATFGDCAGTCGGADALAGGTLTVNGQLIIVPRNTIVTLPAT